MLARPAGPGGSSPRLRRNAPAADQVGTPVFHRQFTAGDVETRATLQAMGQALRQAQIGDEDISNVELILAEALNNIAEHAYSAGSGPVELTVAAHHNGMVCSILDHGRPMPAGLVPSPPLPQIEPPDHLPEGGFGWHIIRCLTTQLSYQRHGDRNCLRMRVPWSEFD